MKLIIVHYHLRPGGVRQIIELVTPQIVRELSPQVDEVVLATGEGPDPEWLHHFRSRIPTAKVECKVDGALAYLTDQLSRAQTIARKLRRFLGNLLPKNDTPNKYIVWAHNLSLARNPFLARELANICKRQKITLLLHHHDWWFDNRWQRWQEMRKVGFATLSQVANTTFPDAANIHHITINQQDASTLKSCYPARTWWLPNPIDPAPDPTPEEIRAARRWLKHRLGRDYPVWLMPCRLLRRKNIAEGLLLTRWLNPDAHLVTTGPTSSDDEEPYAQRLVAAINQHQLPLHLCILDSTDPRKPTVRQLMQASEVTLLTSLQEGFGLAYIEAARTRRPLIVRSLPNIVPDLIQLGFYFPHLYQEILIHPNLFDWEAEVRRQEVLFTHWLKQLPRTVRRFIETPPLLTHPYPTRPIPFSKLTLSAQLEILTVPPDASWHLCAPLNPYLNQWRYEAQRKRLSPITFGKDTLSKLSVASFANRFSQIIHSKVGNDPNTCSSRQLLEKFLSQKLKAENLYPLLWHRIT